MKVVKNILIVALIAVIAFLMTRPAKETVKVVKEEVKVPVEKIISQVWFVSEPSGADVKIDDNVIGQTPCSKTWNNQNWDVVISKENYEEYRTTVNTDKNPINVELAPCLLYTSPSPRDVEESRMPSSA